MAHGVVPAVNSGGIAGAGRQFTAELWDGFDPSAFQRNPAMGHFFQDNFLTPPVFAANSAAGSNYGNYNGFTSGTAGTTIGFSGLQGGGVRLASTTQNEMNSLQFGVYGNRPFQFVSTQEDDTWTMYGADGTAQGYTHTARIRFETRAAVNSVTAGDQSIFIGFSGVLAAADLDTGTTGDVVTTKPFVGFQAIGPTANATLQFICQNATATPTVIATMGTLAANTWFTCGLDWDPSAPPTQRMSLWFNGAKSGTYLTATQALTNFPLSGDTTQYQLSPAWMRSSGSGSDLAMVVGGFRVCQELRVAQGNEACA